MLTFRKVIAVVSLVLAGTTETMAVKPQSKDTLKTVIVHELYGSRDYKYVPSSVSTIDSHTVSQNSVLSFGNALYGRMAGLFVKQANGEPGSDYPTLYIRGKHTFSGSNSPLVIVDGFPRDFNTLNVDEVESVTVLKDAASAALYGMDGANGVILVTTKRGEIGKTKVSFKAEYGFASPTRLPSFYGSYDYARFYNMAERNDGKSTLTYSDDQLNGYLNHSDDKLYPDVDWIDETLRNVTSTQNYSIGISGGNKVAKFYVNLGYQTSDGLFKEFGDKTYDANNKLDRFNFRSNIDVSITRDLSMTVDIAGRMENVNSPYNSSSNIWTNLYTFHPNVAPIYASPGVWGGTNTYRNNPVAYINDMGYRRTHRRLLQTNIHFDYDLNKLVKGMKVGLAAAFDNFYTVDNGYYKTYTVQSVLSYDEATQQYTYSDMYGKKTDLTAFGPSDEKETRFDSYEFYVSYDKTFGNHALNAKVIGHTDSSESYLTYSDLAGSPDRRVSLSGLVSYSYQHKYLVDLAASYGGGENFMRGKRFGFFPTIAGAWIITSENFMNRCEAIDFMKLRASIGKVGNQNVGGTAFGYRNLYVSSNGSWGAGTNNGSYSGGYKEAAIGNSDLTWERALKTDVGLDMTLWKKLQITIDYFHEYRTDILNSGDAILPAYMGVSLGYLNYGKVKSDGVESSISYQQQFKDWGYQCGLNATYQKNKITQMSETPYKYSYLYRQGHSIGQRYGLICEGYYSESDVQNRQVTQSFGKVIPGSLKYTDINNDGVVNSDDYQAIGKDTDVPDWELGFNFGVNYKNLYLSGNIQACLGRDVNLRVSAPYAASPLYYDRNISTYVKQPWTAEAANDPQLASQIDFPSLSIENSSNNFQISTFYQRNGDFMRLRTLEIGYNFPTNWMKRVKLSSASVYLRGMNLLTLDHIKSFDPEVLEGYPVMKSYNIGINLTF